MAILFSYLNSWKNKLVFQKQLDLNLRELNSYPPHWKEFLHLVSEINPSSVLDIGCGVGTYKELLKREFPSIEYFGIDYSAEAIELAKETWGGESWEVKDFWELTSEYVNKYDLIHAGALLDVFPNGNEAFDFLLSLGAPKIIFGRMKIIAEESCFKEYSIYENTITTYEYFHSLDDLKEVAEKYSYTLELLGNASAATVVAKKQ